MPKSVKPSRRVVLPSQTAVFTGTFDPITLGHLDVIRRASGVFPRLVVGVGSNPDKSSLFSLDERVELVRECTAGLSGVEVQSFDGLAVDFVRATGAGVILRGVRSVADMDYEFTMARTNRVLEPAAETVFMPASEAYSHISSTLIRQIARSGGRRQLTDFVPAPVIEKLMAKSRSHR